MNIRLARPKDIQALMLLYHHLSKGYQDNPDTINEAIKYPSTFLFVAEQNGVVVGTATLTVRVVPCAGFVGYVDDVVVDPAYQRQGVAAALLNELQDAAVQLKCIRIELTSNPKRADANRLYEKLGYEFRDTNVYRLVL